LARQILENPIYKEAYEQIERNIINQLAQQATKLDEAEELRRLLIALRKVRMYTEQVVVTGTMEALKRRQSLLDKLTRA
jgi:hypothetical protein